MILIRRKYNVVFYGINKSRSSIGSGLCNPGERVVDARWVHSCFIIEVAVAWSNELRESLWINIPSSWFSSTCAEYANKKFGVLNEIFCLMKHRYTNTGVTLKYRKEVKSVMQRPPCLLTATKRAPRNVMRFRINWGMQ